MVNERQDSRVWATATPRQVAQLPVNPKWIESVTWNFVNLPYPVVREQSNHGNRRETEGF
jgi:hypothetical protein